MAILRGENVPFTALNHLDVFHGDLLPVLVGNPQNLVAYSSMEIFHLNLGCFSGFGGNLIFRFSQGHLI